MPFCNPALPLEARAKDMISRMTLDEKVKSLGNSAPGVAGLGTHPYQWWEEASTGVMVRGKSRGTTKFAYPITTGMSFNRSLWRATGNQIGREARAMMNVGQVYSTFWAPVINLAREVQCPRCPRCLPACQLCRCVAVSCIRCDTRLDLLH
jgi:pre-mRNA-splicing factor SYF2/beta-D-xylosidase 4